MTIKIQEKTMAPQSVNGFYDAICQALTTLLSAWLEINAQEDHLDIVIQKNDKPVFVLIPYQDYEILEREEILQDIREGREAMHKLQALQDDPTTAISFDALNAELVTEGLLDSKLVYRKF
jgi:prevent-host-death family protein